MSLLTSGTCLANANNSICVVTRSARCRLITSVGLLSLMSAPSVIGCVETANVVRKRAGATTEAA